MLPECIIEYILKKKFGGGEHSIKPPWPAAPYFQFFRTKHNPMPANRY